MDWSRIVRPIRILNRFLTLDSHPGNSNRFLGTVLDGVAAYQMA
jgi:hypothetical protein